MYPLTRDVPKPLLEVAGAPMLSHLLARTAGLPGVDEVVVVGHRFTSSSRLGRRELPWSLLDDGSSDESDRLGALGDLAFAAREIPLAGRDALVAAGDNLMLFDLTSHARAFARRRTAQIAFRRAPADAGASRYGEVTLDAERRVVRFREKPSDPQSDLASIALYFFPASTWSLLDRYLEEGGNRDAPGHFIAWLAQRTEVHAEPSAGPWFDIGDLDSLARARAAMRDHRGARGRPRAARQPGAQPPQDIGPRAESRARAFSQTGRRASRCRAESIRGARQGVQVEPVAR
jgi:glucose-1-phosphate thymidylyltransferase